MAREEIEDLRKQIEEHEERIQELEEAVDNSVALDKQLSMPEFVNNEVEPNYHKEKIITVGYYLEAFEGQETFDKNDLEQAYEKCGMKKASNFSDRAGSAVSNGWLKIEHAGDSGTPRRWTLTKTGADKVEEMKGEDNN